MTSEIRANTLKNRVGLGTVSFTNTGPIVSGILTTTGDVYLGNDIYLTDGSGGYEQVEVSLNDIRVKHKHIHSEFGVWTRSTSVTDRKNGIESGSDDLRLYSNSTEKVRIDSSGSISYRTSGGKGFTFNASGSSADAANVFAPASYTLAFGTNNAERLRIFSSGNVNIGAGSSVSGLSPLLHLHKNLSSSTAYLHITNNSTGITNNDGFLLGINGVGDCLVFNKDSTPIRFATAGLERLRITSNGQVGISTFTTLGDATLIVEGVTALTNIDQTIMVRDSNADDAAGRGGNIGFGAYVNGTMRTLAGIGGIKQHAGNSFNGGLALYTRRNAIGTLDERVRITADGDLGLGIDAPARHFHLHVDSSAANYQLFTNSTTGSNNNDGLLVGITANEEALFWNYESTDLRLATAATERLRIKSDGKVGINCINPNSLLEVRGTAGTYTNGITVFTGNTTHSGSNSKNGVGLYSFGDALKGGLSSNLLYSNSSTPSQSYATRSSGKIEISNTTASNQTSLITFGGYYKGTTTFVERLRIEHTGDITFANNNTNATANLSSLIFANSTGEVSSIKGATRNGNTNGMIIFNTDISGTSSESMRINHDGGFCVGTDSTRTAEFSHPDGFSIRSRDASRGQFQNTVTDVMGGLMNRDGSDGAILGFRREGSVVGHIGVNASTMYLNFGGTSAGAHQLDDYEEGNYTPTATLGSGSITSTTSFSLRYIKIGRYVHLFGRLHFSTSQENLSSFQLSLPFANSSGNNHDTSCMVHVIRGDGGNPVQGIRILRAGPGGTVMYMNNHTGNTYGDLGTTTPHININFSYCAAS